MLENISLVYLIGILLYQSSIIAVRYITYVASFLLLKNSIFFKYNLERSFFIIYFLIISLINKNIKLLFLILLVIYIRESTLSTIFKFIKQYFIYGFFLFSLIVLMAKFEIINPQYYIGSAAKIRNGLGFKNPNTASVYYFILVSHYYFFKWDFLKFYDYFLVIIGELFLYACTFSRTGLIVCFFQLMTIIILKNNIKIKNIKKYYFVIPFLFYILNILITFFYTSKLNELMSTRPYTWKTNLLNQKNILNILFGSLGKKAILPLDNGLLNIQFYFGIISVFIFLYLFSKGLKQIEDKYIERTFIIFLSYLVYSLSESMLISPNFGLIQIFIMSRAFKEIKIPNLKNLNYYFLWNYNKLPFIYSILKENEENILIINIQNNKNLKNKLLKLNDLKKIKKIILIENNIKEYIFQIFYRVFIFPLKRNSNFSLFIDGIPGRLPLVLSNLGNYNNLVYYEEGESLYIKNYIFLEKISVTSLRNFINNFFKILLLCPKNSIKNITKFYVRDKKRFFKLLEENNYKPNFEVIEVNEDKELKNISAYDKELLKNIFLSKVNIEKNNNKKAIILTQPLYFDNPLSKEESIKIFNDYIKKLQSENYEIYIKLHPRESQDDNYTKENIKRIEGEFPFELLTLLDINFDIGVTYNSTAINCNFINKKILLKNIIDSEKK